jgi:ABC-type phosphate/phosphonate transport system substrate-binding protein
MAMVLNSYAAEGLTSWFPPAWMNKADKAREIVKALGSQSGLEIRPRIARNYPEILAAFSKNEQNLVYVGSFVQAIIKARGLGMPLVQTINGKELYSGILVYPKGQDPAAILRDSPELIAYTVGASSGESSAKAATAGKASIGTANHGATCAAVVAGKAKAGFVKNWWWEANGDKFPGLATYELPGVSVQKNPDNVLTASKAVPADVMEKITAAAISSKEVFGGREMAPLNADALDFSLELMQKGKIDPMTYTW